jgi:hypothetical protein
MASEYVKEQLSDMPQEWIDEWAATGKPELPKGEIVEWKGMIFIQEQPAASRKVRRAALKKEK